MYLQQAALGVSLRELPEARGAVAALPAPSVIQSGVFAKRTASAAKHIPQKAPRRSGQRKSETPVMQTNNLLGHNSDEH